MCSSLPVHLWHKIIEFLGVGGVAVSFTREQREKRLCVIRATLYLSATNKTMRDAVKEKTHLQLPPVEFKGCSTIIDPLCNTSHCTLWRFVRRDEPDIMVAGANPAEWNIAVDGIDRIVQSARQWDVTATDRQKGWVLLVCKASCESKVVHGLLPIKKRNSYSVQEHVRVVRKHQALRMQVRRLVTEQLSKYFNHNGGVRGITLLVELMRK